MSADGKTVCIQPGDSLVANTECAGVMNTLHERARHRPGVPRPRGLLLDERRFRDWFALLDDEIDYDVPMRIAMRDYADEFPEGAYRIKDSKAHIDTRIKRLESDARLGRSAALAHPARGRQRAGRRPPSGRT